MKKIIVLVLSLFFAFTSRGQNRPWVVPFAPSGGATFIKTYSNSLQSSGVGSGSFAIAVDRRGYTYIGNGTTVNVVNPSTYTLAASNTGNVNVPVGMAISPDNKFLYVSNFNNNAGTNTISVFDISTPGSLSFVRSIGGGSAFSGSPGWMDINNAGRLYLTIDNLGVFYTITSPSTATPTFGSVSINNNYNNGGANLGSSHAIVVDKSRGLVYVGAQGQNVVQVYSTAGVAQNIVYSTNNMHGIALSPDGNSLYVTSLSGTVSRYNTITTGLPRAAGAAGNVSAPAATSANLGSAVRGVTITPDASKLYVFGTAVGAVRELDPTSLSTNATLSTTLGDDPHGTGSFMLDLGDAPASYGVAAHALHNANYLSNLLRIGAKVDGDTTNTTSSTNAAFDDNSNPITGVTDDEDAFTGNTAPDVRANNSTYNISIPVLNNSGTAAKLVVWVDFNRDGDFADAGETSALQTVASAAGTQNISISFSGFTTSSIGTTFMRIRLSTDAAFTNTAAAARDGVFWDGEVEDFTLQVVQVINPDFNSGYTNQQLRGNLKTNDNPLAGSTYGAVSGPPAGITNPSTALPTINADGTYTFTSSVPGVYTFDVPVCAGSPAVCVMNRLTITIAAPAATTNPPVANPDLASTNAGTPVTLNTLANDKPGSNSPGLNPSTVTITTQPANGTATVDPATGNITYTPNAGFTGNDTLRYQVCDSATPTPRCATSYQVITVDPAGVNNTSASDDYNTGRLGTTITGNVLNNDKDAQGNTQTVTPVSQTIAGVGTVTINASGGYTFTPAAGTTYTGPVNVPYTVCDNGTPQSCASATLYLLIAPNPTPLPVDLLDFRLEGIKDCKARLYWKTGTETAFSYFELAQSSDAHSFKAIGKISAKGSGSKYRYEADLEDGSNYFRLKIVDNDLSYKLSNIISAQSDCAAAQIKIYPTLVKDKISIEGLSGAESIQIFDMNGKRVYNATAAAGTQSIAVKQYAAGVYALVIITPQSEMIIEKFVKQ